MKVSVICTLRNKELRHGVELVKTNLKRYIENLEGRKMLGGDSI